MFCQCYSIPCNFFRFLKNPTKDVDLRKWAAEGLVYLTLDADVKEELVEDTDALRSVIDLAKVSPLFKNTLLIGFIYRISRPIHIRWLLFWWMCQIPTTCPKSTKKCWNWPSSPSSIFPRLIWKYASCCHDEWTEQKVLFRTRMNLSNVAFNGSWITAL